MKLLKKITKYLLKKVLRKYPNVKPQVLSLLKGLNDEIPAKAKKATADSLLNEINVNAVDVTNNGGWFR